MSSIEVLPYDAPREQWLAQRRKGIGGSDVSAIMGMSRFSSARQVWLEKLGAPEQAPSWAMMKGALLEPGLRWWYQLQTGVDIHMAGLQQSTQETWMQYNPDGFIGADGILEGKTASFFMSDEWSDEQVADHAELQVQWGMLVTGRQWGDVIAAVSDNEPVIRRVHANTELQDLLLASCRQFWLGNVQARVEPPVTWVDADAIKKEYPAVEKTAHIGDSGLDEATKTYQHAAQVVKDYTKVKDTAATVIRRAMETADHLVINGETAATWKQQTARVLDLEALAADVDLEQYRTDRVTRVLRIPKTRKPFRESA